jgi:myo-inositol-1-phosphate synthase
MIGTHSITSGRMDMTGMVTDLREFRSLDLPTLDSFIFGGWEIRSSTLMDGAEELYRVTRSISAETLAASLPFLEEVQRNVRPGVTFGLNRLLSRFPDVVLPRDCAAASVERLRQDIRDFRKSNGIERVIVVNVASTEPLPTRPLDWSTPEAFAAAVGGDDDRLTPALLYAYASLLEGCPYLNFTPSAGTEVPGLSALALANGLPHSGKDGKTGETLLKTVLAPMFVARNFRVLAWEGFNMLGNRDGLILDDPGSNSAKIANKDAVLKKTLGDRLGHTRTRIDYVPSLDDWKVAWDYIHFEGFMGTRMSLSFQWNGCDSMLAAPLVLDLVRLLCHEHSRGAVGIQKQLAVFFKNPIGTGENDFIAQHFELLRHYR